MSSRFLLVLSFLLSLLTFEAAGQEAPAARAVTNHASVPQNGTNSTSATNHPGFDQEFGKRSEAIRSACIEGRRRICGRVLEIRTNGIVVDSGFTSLLRPELSRSWVAPSTVAAERPQNIIEEKTPGAPAVGLVMLIEVPRRPSVKQYDYVIIEGYPAGEAVYAPVPGVKKNLRRFSARLESAIRLSFEAEKTKVEEKAKSSH